MRRRGCGTLFGFKPTLLEKMVIQLFKHPKGLSGHLQLLGILQGYFKPEKPLKVATEKILNFFCIINCLLLFLYSHVRPRYCFFIMNQ
jgi:hypothetical protein